MTAKQVALSFHGECKGVNGWCDVHESGWAFRVSARCNRMSSYIDLAEQAVEAYQEDLRHRVEALPDEHHYGKDRGGCIDRAAVLALIDGAGS